jgi:hypothetical protein
MFHPVGQQPAAVYWRRRLVFFATLLLLGVLIVVTARVFLGGDGAAAPPAGSSGPSVRTTPTSPHTTPPTSTHAVSSTPSAPHTSGSGTTSGSTSTAPPPRCERDALQVQAVTDHTSYSVGAKPKLMLQVTNTAKTPCVQDLADAQVELRVYNGASRVWGSHDCMVQSGTNDVILMPSAPVRVTIVWSGLSSKANSAHTQAACGPRQTVGAGTYTLFPYLAGKSGKASEFSIS